MANGDKMWTKGICKKVLCETQGFQQTTDFLILPLKGCDLVLGVQLLKELGLILWDFETLVMWFAWKNE